MRQLVAMTLLSGALLASSTAACAMTGDADPSSPPRVIVPPPIGQLQIAPLVPFKAPANTVS